MQDEDNKDKERMIRKQSQGETEILFDCFATLAAAPGGIGKIRELILQLAVQGKLVPQNPDDEPASVLLERIKTEKARLVKEGKIKKSNQLPPVREDEVPFEQPVGWVIVRLGDVVDYNGRQKIDPKKILKEAWLLELEDIEKDTSRLLQRITAGERDPRSTKSLFKEGDVLYGKLRPYLNKVIVADQNGYCTTEIAPIRIFSDIIPKYLMYVLKRPAFIEYVNSKSYGMKMPRLGTSDAINAILPLPPLAEQHRIVEKVDALLELCDELEARQMKQREMQAKLGVAVLASLTEAEDATAFADAWARICDEFDLIFDTVKNITALRQAILQLAVQGKLVPQNSEDEPVSVLLERIKTEKAKLVKEGKIKRSKPLPPVEKDEVPYTVPKVWKWVRLGNLIKSLKNGIYKPAKFYSDDGVACLRMYNVSGGKINYNKLKRMILKNEEIDQYLLKENDLLVNRVNSRELVGKAAVIKNDSEPLIFESKNIRVRFFYAAIISEYVNILFQTIEVKKAFEADAKQTCGQASISQPQISAIITPLPPLAEQYRIVEKVDAFMKLCDELEQRIKKREEIQTSLLESIVAQIAA